MEQQQSELVQLDQLPALGSTGEAVAILEKTDKKEDNNNGTSSAVTHAWTGVTAVNNTDSRNSKGEDMEEETTATRDNVNLERKHNHTSTKRNGEEMKEGTTAIVIEVGAGYLRNVIQGKEFEIKQKKQRRESGNVKLITELQ
eukprot:8221513-Ditylum_brightwellii.AAC.1